MFRRIVPAALLIAALSAGTVGLRAARPRLPAAPPASPLAPGFYSDDPVLTGYVRAALDVNPAVQEALARAQAAGQQIAMASTLPDPMLTFGQSLRSVETRVGPQLNSYTLSQSLPWFGKLDLRGKVAAQGAEAAQARYVMRQRDIIAQVKEAYDNLGYVDAALGITREEQALLDHYEQVARDRYATGQGLEQGVIKLQAELTQIVSRLDLLQQQRVSLAASLNTLMARDPSATIPPVAVLKLPAPPPLGLDQLYALGNAHRPDLQGVSALIAGDRSAIDLAKKNFWPDLTLSAGFINIGRRGDPAGLAQPPPDNGKNALTVMAGFTLPIHRDTYRADVTRAADTLSSDEFQRTDVRNQMTFTIRDEVVRLQTLREQVRLFTDVLLPQTDQELRASEAAYENGQLGLLDLLDSERSRLSVRLINARNVADYLVALARLEHAVGTAFPEK
ncbi:MAG TPA: TolC family protein [Vicinamibacterales bacterium]|nr:TolC family protein [Vicinamibacterales bacterium]